MLIFPINFFCGEYFCSLVKIRLLYLPSSIILLKCKLNFIDAVPVNGSKRLITGRKAILTGGIHVSVLTTDRLAVGRPLDARGNPLPLDDILMNVVRYLQNTVSEHLNNDEWKI